MFWIFVEGPRTSFLGLDLIQVAIQGFQCFRARPQEKNVSLGSLGPREKSKIGWLQTQTWEKNSDQERRSPNPPFGGAPYVTQSGAKELSLAKNQNSTKSSQVAKWLWSLRLRSQVQTTDSIECWFIFDSIKSASLASPTTWFSFGFTHFESLAFRAMRWWSTANATW